MEELDRVHEAEAKNFQFAKVEVGDSASLIEDLIGLYGLLADFVKKSGVAPSDETVVASLFLIACRYQLTMSALTAMRGHLNDSFYFTRKAIELCALARYIMKHPHLAMEWLQAWHGKSFYEKFRKKFSASKLFPKDDALLELLYGRYDHCSKMVHSSIFSLGGHFEVYETGSNFGFNFEYSQLKQDDPSEPIRTLLWVVDTHFGIIRVFEGVMDTVVAHDRATWEVRKNAVDAKIGVHKKKWESTLQIPGTNRQG